MGDETTIALGALYSEPSRNGLTKPKRVRGAGTKFVNMNEIFRYDRLKDIECDRVPLDEAERNHSLLAPNDLLFARQSLVLSGAGKCVIFIGDKEDVAFESHIIRVRLDQNKADPFFYYYLFRCQEGRNIIEAIVEQGAGASGIRGSDLKKLIVPYPPLREQKAIVELLAALDDKIELNRRTNETLEAMARALFKDWFVDFGPTRAKMEGREPYLAPDLWALFPDRLDDATGLPEGWEQLPLGSFGEITIGGLWGNDEPENSDYEPYFCLRGVDLQHLREQGAALKTPCRFAKRAAIEKRTVRTTDVLIASSGAGPCGRPLWIGVQGFFAGRAPTIYSNFVKRIACKTNYHACYVDRHLHEMKVSGEIQKYISGTSVPNLNDKGLMESHKIPSPTEPILQAFLDFSMLVQEQLFSGENAVLAEARDLLLPKLMSGEIRLRDAEKLAEEAAA